MAHQVRRRYDGVAECSEQALAIWREIGNRYGQAWSLHSLGTVDRRLGRLPEAIDRCREAATIRHEIGDSIGEAAALQSLAKALQEDGEQRQARHALLRAVAILDSLGSAKAAAGRDRIEALDQPADGSG